MIYFIDTSSLVKRYSIETGSDNVDRYLDTAADIFVSPVTKLETHSAIRRILEEKIIDQNTYQGNKSN